MAGTDRQDHGKVSEFFGQAWVIVVVGIVCAVIFHFALNGLVN